MNAEVRNRRDHPFPGGFLLAQHATPDNVADFFSHTPLPGGWQLWTDGDELVDTDMAAGQSDRFVLIRGNFTDLAEHPSSAIAEDLLSAALTSEAAFEQRLAEIGGRFVVLARFDELRIYQDPLGLRSVYYSLDSPLVASHLNLLLRFEDHPSRGLPVATAFKAMDEAPHFGVRNLLPNHYLDVARSTIHRFWPTRDNQYRDWTAEDRYELVEALWSRHLSRHLERHPQLVISVTGGLDSRLMLAMGRKHLPDMHAFTYGIPTPGKGKWHESMYLDHRIVEDMLPYLDFQQHNFFNISAPPPASEELRQLLDQNTPGNNARKLIPHYRQEFPGQNWFHLRGTGVEVVRRYWPAPDEDPNRVLRFLTQADSPDLAPRFAELGYREPIADYNLWDLVYWEIRMGKWHAEVLNETDAAYDTFLPMASREMLDALLAFNVEERRSAVHVRELINRNFPILNFFGANDPRNLYEQFADLETEHSPHLMHGHTVLLGEGGARPWPFQNRRELRIPREDFQQDNRPTAIIKTMADAGALQFTVDQRYLNPKGHGVFEWAVLVGNKKVLRCDGAATRLPVHVTITGLQAQDVVKLQLRVLRTQNSISWETATRTTVREVATSSAPETDLAVHVDNPHVTVL